MILIKWPSHLWRLTKPWALHFFILCASVGFAKVKIFAERSIGKMVFRLAVQLFTRGKKMDNKVALGSVGELDLSISGGKASIVVSTLPGNVPASASLSVVIDAGALIDLLKAAIEKKFPASTPIDEAVFAVLKAAVMAV